MASHVLLIRQDIATPWWFILRAFVGAAYVGFVALRLLAYLWLCLPRMPKGDLRRRYGEWAVVTGPTSGIGRAMALELTRHGLNLVLVGRDPAILRQISDTIASLSLIVVNNAGVAEPGAVYLHEADVEAWARMVRVNVSAVTEVTAAVLPGMVARGRGGAVVNIGSAASESIPSLPLYTMYVAQFSRSLHVEYASKGILVQCQAPFFVDTRLMFRFEEAAGGVSLFTVTPDAYARAAVAWIGRGGALCTPGVRHQLLRRMAAAVPDSVHDWILLHLTTWNRKRRFSGSDRWPSSAPPTSPASLRLLAYVALCLGRRRGRGPKDLRRYGACAVITGPKSGIGRAMALELARRGLNLVLVGRDPARLREISGTIRSRHGGVQTKAVEFDLSLASTPDGDEPLRRLREAVAGLDVGVVVNNAGEGRPGAVYLHEADAEAWVRMARVNVSAVTEVTAAVLPGMVERGRGGAVVNLGSAASEAIPSFPLYTMYAATKRYVAQFSRSLHVEYANKGIHVQCQTPFFVETTMLAKLEEEVGLSVSALTVSTDTYARAAVAWIGRGGPLCTPAGGLLQQLMWCVTAAVPESVLDWLVLRFTTWNRGR
uniref:B-keto acyl reductase n=1 Tax=Oryza meridionalis TaxID=40149 RepID=A0A0E0E144_9ORYZ